MRTLLHVVHYPVFGGPHNQALRLAEPLRGRGWETLVLLPDEPGNAAGRLRDAGVEVVTLPLHRLRATIDPMTQVRFGVGFPRELRSMRRLIRERQVELVVVTSLTNPHAAFAARLEGVPVTWQLIDTRAPMALRRLLMPLVLRLSDSVMSTGYKVAAMHPGALTLGDRLVTFFPPVDTDEFRPDEDRRAAARAELGVAPQVTLVGAVGNLVPQKGYEYLLRSAAAARRTLPELVVRILGSHTETHRVHESRLRALAVDLGFDPAATFVDPGSRVSELVPAFDLAVMSAVPRSEGITTGLLEAISCGVPVVATDVGAVSEGVDDGVTGIMVPPEDVPALAAAIVRLGSDGDLRRAMGAAGRSRAVEAFSLDASASAHVNAFERALDHHGLGRAAARPAGRGARRPAPRTGGREKMRVLIVNKFAHVTGGADQHVIGLAAALRDKGHDVRILTTASPLNVERDGRFVPLIVTNSSRDELPAFRRAEVAGRAVWNWSAARQMRLLLEEFRPDVIHVHKLYPQISVAPVVVAGREGIPVVQTLHDLELIAANPLASGGEWRDRLEERADYRALNTATFAIRRFVHRPGISAFVAPSKFVADLHRNYGVDAEVIPNFTEFAGGLALPGYDERDGILFVGRLSPHKGVLDVIELARALPEHSLTVAGAGPLEERVRAHFKALPNATYVGAASRQELETLYRKARVVVMPSSFPEIGPLAAIEAMALGTPVVGYSHSGLAEYVSDAGGGLIVEASADALVRAAAEIHDDPELWGKLSRAASTSVSRRHAPGNYADRIVDVYSRVRSRVAAH